MRLGASGSAHLCNLIHAHAVTVGLALRCQRDASRRWHTKLRACMTRGPVSRGAVKPLTSVAQESAPRRRGKTTWQLPIWASLSGGETRIVREAAYILASTDDTACTDMPGTVRQASRKDSQSSDVLRCEPIGGDLLRRWLWLEALALALALARARALALARARALALARARALALAPARALAEHARHGALRRRSVCQ